MPQIFTFGRLVGASFALTVLGFGIGLGITLDRHAARPDAPPQELPRAELIYIPLQQPIATSIRNNKRTLEVQLTFAVAKGTVDLASMAGSLTTDLPLLVTELSEAVRLTDEAAATPEALRSALPEALRRAVNTRYATDDLPEPVREVLITEFRID